MTDTNFTNSSGLPGPGHYSLRAISRCSPPPLIRDYPEYSAVFRTQNTRSAPGAGQPARIREIRVRHAEAPGLAVHPFHERRFRARDGFGKRDAGIVCPTG